MKDNHIPPAEEIAGNSNFSKKNNGTINKAMHIARSRVQFPKEQRAQNINEFIDQKKEMFLAELACNTVNEEIKQLEIKLKRRDNTLLMSKKELSEDNNDLMHFIQNDNTNREQKVQEQRNQEVEKQKKDEEIKKLDAQIQQEKSEIEKNKDALIEQATYQSFVLGLKPQFQIERLAKMKQKKEKLKREWIEKYKKDRSMDHIIFQDDEEIHDQIKMQFGFLKEQPEKPTIGATRDRRGQQRDDRDRVTDAEWGKRFEDLLSLHLIDVPDDYYDDDRAFNDPDELNTIFNELEEKNLFNIHQLQELELQLEQLNQDEKNIKENLQQKFENQSKTKSELANKILES